MHPALHHPPRPASARLRAQQLLPQTAVLTWGVDHAPLHRHRLLQNLLLLVRGVTNSTSCSQNMSSGRAFSRCDTSKCRRTARGKHTSPMALRAQIPRCESARLMDRLSEFPSFPCNSPPLASFGPAWRAVLIRRSQATTIISAGSRNRRRRKGG